MNMSSINGSNNSRKALNKKWLVFAIWFVGQLESQLTVVAKSDVRPRKFDIFTLNLKKKSARFCKHIA